VTIPTIPIWITVTLGVLLLVAGVSVRAVWSWRWHRALVALSLRLPHGLSLDDIIAWLGTVHAHTTASRWRLVSGPPVVLEISATRQGIGHLLWAPEAMRAGLLARLQASFPGIRADDASDLDSTRPRLRIAAELRLSTFRRPLAAERAPAACVAFLAGLQPLYGTEEIRVQWILTGARTPALTRTPRHSAQAGLPWWLDAQAPPDADDIRAQRAKHNHLLLHASARIGVAASTRKRARALLGRVWGPLRMLNAPGVRVGRRWWIPARLAAWRLRRIAWPFGAWPLLLNTKEAAGLIGLPAGNAYIPGLIPGGCRQLAPPPAMPSTGVVIATSNYPGMTRPLALLTEDRLRHMWIHGPTGVGKSTLKAAMICQDITAGFPLLLLDPGDDLVRDVLARVPEHRREDVVILDPTDIARPIGFNILRVGHGVHARELAVDHILHILGEMFKSSWGPRTADVLRASLLTLTSSKAVDGSTFTLCELPELLTNSAFRRSVTRQAHLAGGVREFWSWYENLSEAERGQVIGPVLNKLRAFTLKTPLRLILGQSDGLNLTDIFTQNRIVLVPLSKGVVGAETAQLLGALLLASFWQTTLGRSQTPAEHRRPAWLYVDEFQDVLRLPLDLADMLAQARKLGVGLILAHQYLGQLPEGVKTAIRNTTRTHVTFQSDYDDAHKLAHSYAPLSPEEITALAAYEVAIRPCVGNQVLRPVTGTTAPLPDPISDPAALAEASRARYGMDRSDIEQGLIDRVHAGRQSVQIGRTSTPELTGSDVEPEDHEGEGQL
jgi:Type IV secretion-system coupling protein DNA-binding domain